MPNTNTPEQTQKFDRRRAVHQPFSWIFDDAKDYPMADFVALTMDIADGIHTCLEIVQLSNLIRSENDDRAPEDAELPAVNANDAGKLQRLTIAATRLLRDYAARRIDWINEYGPESLRPMKARAK